MTTIDQAAATYFATLPSIPSDSTRQAFRAGFEARAPVAVATSDAERASVLLSDADLRRIYTRVMGGNRFDGNELMLMREVEHAANEKHGVALPIDFKQATDQGGWQLVPKEPTETMLDEGWNALDAADNEGDFVSPDGIKRLWRAMLAAPTLLGVADGDAVGGKSGGAK